MFIYKKIIQLVADYVTLEVKRVEIKGVKLDKYRYFGKKMKVCVIWRRRWMWYSLEHLKLETWLVYLNIRGRIYFIQTTSLLKLEKFRRSEEGSVTQAWVKIKTPKDLNNNNVNYGQWYWRIDNCILKFKPPVNVSHDSSTNSYKSDSEA